MKKHLSFFRKIVAFSLLLVILFAGSTTNSHPIDENHGVSLCSDRKDSSERNNN